MKQFVILICLFSAHFFAFGQQLPLEHFYPKEYVTRAKWSNGEHYYSGYDGVTFKLYNPDHTFQRSFEIPNRFEGYKYSARVLGVDLGVDTLVKFSYVKRGSAFAPSPGSALVDETGRVLFRRDTLNNGSVSIYFVDGRLFWENCLYNTRNFTKEYCFRSNEYIRTKDSLGNELFIQPSFSDGLPDTSQAAPAPFLDILDSRFQTIQRINLPKSRRIEYYGQINLNALKSGYFYYLAPYHSICVRFIKEPYIYTHLYNLKGQLLFADTSVRRGDLSGDRFFNNIGKNWYSLQYYVSDRDPPSDTAVIKIISRQDFKVKKEFVGVADIWAADISTNNEKLFVRYVNRLDSLFIFNTDFTLYRKMKIPNSPNFTTGYFYDVSQLTMNSDSLIEITYHEIDVNNQTNVIVANERQEILALVPKASFPTISVIPGLKNKLIVQSSGNYNNMGYGTCVFTLPSGTATATHDMTEGGKYMTLYPNPARDLVNIDFSNLTIVHKAQLVVTDILGRTVKTVALDNLTDKYVLDVSNVANGSYLCVLLSDNKPLQSVKFTILR